MDLSTILGFVALIGALMFIGGLGMAVSNASQRHSARPGIILALAGLIIAVVFFLVSSGLVIVGPTEVKVVFQSVAGDKNTNSLWPVPLGPGVHIVTPVINQVFTYTTEVRTYTMSKTANEGAKGGDDSVQVRTSDGQQVYIDISVIYNIDPVKVNSLHLKYQQRYEEDFVRPTVRGAVRDIVSAYVVEDLLGEKRNELKVKLLESVRQNFSDVGLNLSDIIIRNITFSDEYIQAVEQKQVAQQQAEQAKQEAERKRTIAKGDADAAVTKAQGDADAAVAAAKGEAQAIELRAGADAKALALINEQLQKNPMLIQWRYIEKLGGNVSLILVPSNSPYLFDPKTLMESANSGTSSSTSSSSSSAGGATP
jgi:regulator of protease activity HflC (stomatin/prohibitin superfamily)